MEFEEFIKKSFTWVSLLGITAVFFIGMVEVSRYMGFLNDSRALAIYLMTFVLVVMGFMFYVIKRIKKLERIVIQ